jgi:transcriptional regulator with XRE-family HTH domain
MKIDHFTPIEIVLEEIGRRLAVTRKAQSLSQQELAAAAGIGVATLRRIEGGNDGNMGSWIKVLRALGMIAAVEGLLPEEFRSPMADAKASRKRKPTQRKKAPRDNGPWGGEAP